MSYAVQGLGLTPVNYNLGINLTPQQQTYLQQRAQAPAAALQPFKIPSFVTPAAAPEPAPVVAAAPVVVPLHPTISQGSVNTAAVKLWQTFLGITADGKFGSGTTTATKAFQTANGLTADGIVGPQTWGKADDVQNARLAALPAGVTITSPPMAPPTVAAPDDLIISEALPPPGSQALVAPTGMSANMKIGLAVGGVVLVAVGLRAALGKKSATPNRKRK